MKKRTALGLFLTLFSFFAAPRAEAISFGDAALTIGISVGAGAILGASTLPFYSQPGDHTKNIFVGAAFGAVAGVLISAAAGVKDGDLEDANAHALHPNELFARRDNWVRPEADLALASNSRSKDQTIFWSPLAKLTF